MAAHTFNAGIAIQPMGSNSSHAELQLDPCSNKLTSASKAPDGTQQCWVFTSQREGCIHDRCCAHLCLGSPLLYQKPPPHLSLLCRGPVQAHSKPAVGHHQLTQLRLHTQTHRTYTRSEGFLLPCSGMVNIHHISQAYYYQVPTPPADPVAGDLCDRGPS